METAEGKKIYLFAIAGSSHAARADSFECYSDILKLCSRIIEHFLFCREEAGKNKKERRTNFGSRVQDSGTLSFRDFVVRMQSYRVYETIVDSGDKARKLSGAIIWKIIEGSEELKPQITKMLLRNQYDSVAQGTER